MNNFQISNIIYEKSLREPTKEEIQDLLLLLDTVYPIIAAEYLYEISSKNGIVNDNELNNLYDNLERVEFRNNFELNNKIYNSKNNKIQKLFASLGFYYPITWIKHVFYIKKKIYIKQKLNKKYDRNRYRFNRSL